MKDNLIDEERAKQEEAAQESLDQKLERLGKKFLEIMKQEGYLVDCYYLRLCMIHLLHVYVMI